jgi:hypothetical protein
LLFENVDECLSFLFLIQNREMATNICMLLTNNALNFEGYAQLAAANFEVPNLLQIDQ